MLPNPIRSRGLGHGGPAQKARAEVHRTHRTHTHTRHTSHVRGQTFRAEMSKQRTDQKPLTRRNGESLSFTDSKKWKSGSQFDGEMTERFRSKKVYASLPLTPDQNRRFAWILMFQDLGIHWRSSIDHRQSCTKEDLDTTAQMFLPAGKIRQTLGTDGTASIYERSTADEVRRRCQLEPRSIFLYGNEKCAWKDSAIGNKPIGSVLANQLETKNTRSWSF